MIKRTILVIALTCLVGCAYVKEYSLDFRPKNGVEFADEIIDSVTFSLRILASDHSKTVDYFLYHRIMPKGPYALHLSIVDKDKIPKDIILHSFHFETSSKEDVSDITLGNKIGLRIQFKKAVNANDQFLGWTSDYLFENNPIEIPFVEEQNIHINFDVTIDIDGKPKQVELNFPFRAMLIDYKNFVPLSKIYGQ